MVDLIDQVQIENEFDIDNPYLQYQNVAKATATGFEAELKTNIENKLKGFIAFNYQKVLNPITDEEMENSPRCLIKSGFYFPLYVLYLGSNMIYETSRKTLYSARTNDFFLLNLNVGTVYFFDRISFGFKINNVLNRSFQLPASYDLEPIEVVPQNRRNYNFRIEFKL
jgi:outer membrane receptor protein involved in Fe transport